MWFIRPPLLLCCLFLGGCGFRPLYSSFSESGNICYPIKIATIEDRHGQILRNYLLDTLAPSGTPACTPYRLDIKLSESTLDIGLRKDETSRRKQLTITAALKVTNEKGKVVYEQSASSINSYDVLTTNYYADDVAVHYAEKEALRMLAEKISILVIGFLESERDCGRFTDR